MAHPSNAAARRQSKRRPFRLYVRHYCAVCGGRVFPYDKYESLTESPRLGKSGAHVLLSSSNVNPQDRVAWCWSCNHWREAERKTESEFLLLYLKRRGVTVRQNSENANGHASNGHAGWKPKLKPR